jgi:integrase
VPIALTTGMRVAEVFALNWSDILYREELMTIRAMLKGGKCGTFLCPQNSRRS